MLFKTLNVKPYAKKNRKLCDYNLDDKKKLLCYIRAKRIKSFSGGKAYRSLKLYRRSQTNVRYGRPRLSLDDIRLNELHARKESFQRAFKPRRVSCPFRVVSRKDIRFRLAAFHYPVPGEARLSRISNTTRQCEL